MKKILLPAVGCSALTGALSSQKIQFLIRASILIWSSLAISLQLAACNIHGKGIDPEITLELHHTTLTEAPRILQNNKKIPTVHSPDLVKVYTDVSLPKDQPTVRAILEITLKSTDISNTERENAIVLRTSVQPDLGTIQDANSEIKPLIATVSGKVMDATTKEPLVGVNIIIRGTTRGTNTDANGEFVIDADSNETLIVSFIGYKTTELPIGSQTRIDVGLKSDVTTLQEVQVTGTDYYSVSKTKSTMNIEKVSAKDIEDQPVTNIMNSMVGRVAGLDITSYNGAAGVAPKIVIRGNNSLRFDGSYPLYVIDGMQIDPAPLSSQSNTLSTSGFDPLGSINPADIESIEVLKDAAATAIYGSRGANGVIRITTKQNKVKDRTEFDVNFYSGVGQVARHVNLLNTSEYLKMRQEAYRNDGHAVAQEDYSVSGVVWDTTRNINWQKELLGKTSKVSDFQLGFSGGGQNTTFRFSAGIHRENVIYSGDFGYTRGTVGLNINHTSSDGKFASIFSINYGTNKNRLFDDGNYVPSALTLPPDSPPLYDNNGELNWEQAEIFPGFIYPSWTNPLSLVLRTQQFHSKNITSSALLSYQLLDGLTIKTNLGYNQISSNENIQIPIISYAPPDRQYTKGESIFATNDRSSVLVEPQLVYAHMFSQHNANIVIGGTYRESSSAYQSMRATDYKSDELLGTIKGAGSVLFLNDNLSQYKYSAVFARFAYDFKSKYLIDISGRRDGSSRFGPGKRFGNFGAAGLGWVFSNESFVENTLSFISFGKLRGSYGVTGNDQIGDYNYYNSYTISPTSYQNNLSINPKSLFNPDYAWERTKKAELAIELGFIEDRITFQAVWYRAISSNQLVQFPLPATTGFPSILRNFDAKIENTGHEFLLSSLNVTTGNFKWSTSLNLTVPRNKLLAYDGIEDSPDRLTYKVGQPLSIQRLYTYKGVDPNTGDYLIEDSNDDGDINDEDKKFMQPLQRDYYGGISNTVSLNGLELSFLFQFSKGNISSWLPTSPPGGASTNYPSYVLDHWQQEGDNTEWGRYTNDFSFRRRYTNLVRNSDFNTTDASFIRLKTLSLSYKLAKNSLKRRLPELRIYLQAQNLLTFTQFKGLDPETGNALPPLRFISIGLQAKI